MSDLNTSFTFRLTDGDKAALEQIASRLGCDRGAALRVLIRRTDPTLSHTGHFITPSFRQFRVKLLTKGGEA